MQENSRDYTWKALDVPVTGENGQANTGKVFSSGDLVCVPVNKYGSEENGSFIFELDPATGETKLVPVDDLDNADTSFQSMCAGDDGRVYALRSVYEYNDETGEEKNRISLIEFDIEGELLSKWDITPETSTANYYYVDSINYIGDGNLILKDNTGIFIFNTKNEKKRVIYEAPEGYFDAEIKVLGDGTILAITWGSTGYEIKELDVNEGVFSDGTGIDGNISPYYMYPGISHDIYYHLNSNIYYYDRGGKTGKVMDMVASDLLVDEFAGLVEIEDSRLVILANSWGDSGETSSLKVCEHVPPSEVADKEEITLSCVWANSNIMRMTVDFNENNDKYRIRVVDYSQYQTEGDWNAPYTKLNTDIVSGYIPDILVIDEQMPVESYIGKDILADITPFIKNDPELRRVEFLDNVFDAYRINGKLYQLIPSFMVYTGIAGSDLMDGGETLTMSGLKKICAEQGLDLRESFGAMTRDSLFSMLLYMQGTEYIDLSTGKCKFDSPGFIELLELVKQFPTEISDEAYEEEQKAYRERRAVLMLYGLNQFSNYAVARYGYFGNDISMIGIPGSELSGSVVMPQLQIAITTSTKYPEAAWEFVREFLLEDYQDKLSWGFPVRTDSLEKQAQKSKERNFYINEEGEKEEYDETWWIAGQEVVIPPLDDTEVKAVTDFLKNCNRRGYINSTITDIINEESAAFFEGQKEAADVAKIIQSRAQIYVHENR